MTRQPTVRARCTAVAPRPAPASRTVGDGVASARPASLVVSASPPGCSESPSSSLVSGWPYPIVQHAFMSRGGCHLRASSVPGATTARRGGTTSTYTTHGPRRVAQRGRNGSAVTTYRGPSNVGCRGGTRPPICHRWTVHSRPANIGHALGQHDSLRVGGRGTGGSTGHLRALRANPGKQPALCLTFGFR